jgi:hypothetical protein
MQKGDLPEDVLQFIAERIETVPHLEALLLLWEDPARRWTAEEIAARVYVAPETAAKILADLGRHRLSTAAGSASAYDTAWDPSGEAMERVASAYRLHLVQVASFIHSKGSRGVREFARAFELNPKKKS